MTLTWTMHRLADGTAHVRLLAPSAQAGDRAFDDPPTADDREERLLSAPELRALALDLLDVAEAMSGGS